MALSRRRFVQLSAATLPASVSLADIALADDTKAKVEKSWLTPRTMGDPKAPVKVEEWFSLTCVHCAHFALEEFPKIKEKLIDTGKVFYVFNDFPLDRLALMAAMLARYLPEDRYFPFISALLSRQMKWAFSGSDPVEHLRMEAALAGISHEEFDRITKNQAYAEALFGMAQADAKKYTIEGTPFYRFNGQVFKQDPETFEKFEELVKNAPRS